MTYQTTNPRAINHPLRSIPMFRPVQALGAAFYANHVGDEAMARMVAERALELARFTLAGADKAYTASKAAIGMANKLRRKDRHDRALFSDRAAARQISAAFGTMNRARAALRRAVKAVAAAEAAMLALAH